MKTFHCQYCGNPIFFENVTWLQCDSAPPEAGPPP